MFLIKSYKTINNTNELLGNLDGVYGVKTGFTEAAYRCLVSAAEKDGMTLICVTLNCPDDWAVHEQLYEHYFSVLSNTDVTANIPEMLELCNSGIDSQGQIVERVAVNTAMELVFPMRESDEYSVEVIHKPVLFAPISENSVIGEVIVSINGEEICKTELLAAENLSADKQEKEPSLIDRVREFILQLY